MSYLASIIEKVSRKSYSEYLQESIFRPLGMERTFIDIAASKTIKNKAIGYNETEEGFDKTHLYFLRYVGDGQIITTPRDMFKWHQNLKKATIGSVELWNKMHTKAVLNNGTRINYGLGVEFETHNGYEAMGFDGMIKLGFVSKYLYFPELDIAFFTTQNTFDWDFKERFFELIDLYVKKKEEEYVDENMNAAVRLSNEELKRYEGTYLFYQHDEERKANSIKVINNELKVLTLDGDEITELIPLGDHKFLFGEDGDALVEFSFSGNKKQYTYDDFEYEKPWVFKETSFYEHSQEELKEYEGHYFSKDFQVGRKLQLENGMLYYYYRNGAWKDEIGSLSKDVLEIPISPIEFVRDETNKIIGFTIMGVWFEKI
ncbi:serine hydrolase domain-containing protein [uncultured Dokdonia sp.]|uniref:serine hydrolase domain-containing protein n=1 Tax=uncultured Dokdonia sp. TaxID=575653 RepID=UPI002636E0AA|nr:serine hydrolase domain-containing protein [uncultured Dokdonia sp.]